MLDSLLDLGKGQLGKMLQDQTGLEAGKTDEAVEVTKDTVGNGLKDELMKGNFSGVMDLFNGNAPTTTANPIVNGITGNLVTNLAAKLGISASVAQQVANIAIPFIMNKLGSSETGKASNEQDLVEKLGMGGDSALGGVLKNLGGLGGLFK